LKERWIGRQAGMSVKSLGIRTRKTLENTKTEKIEPFLLSTAAIEVELSINIYN
jgi:hypothetical protein